MRDFHFKTSQEPIAVPLPVAASMLGCSVRAVRSLIWSGKLKYAKLGKRFVVSVAELRLFLDRELQVLR